VRRRGDPVAGLGQLHPILRARLAAVGPEVDPASSSRGLRGWPDRSTAGEREVANLMFEVITALRWSASEAAKEPQQHMPAHYHRAYQLVSPLPWTGSHLSGAR
jgi:hypothetical protein